MRPGSDAEEDRGSRAGGSAPRDPEDVGVGEHVAHHCLHRGAAQRQSASDSDPEKHPRDTDIPHDDRFGLRPRRRLGRHAQLLLDDAKNVRGGNDNGADAHDENDGQGEKPAEPSDPRGGAQLSRASFASKSAGTSLKLDTSEAVAEIRGHELRLYRNSVARSGLAVAGSRTFYIPATSAPVGDGPNVSSSSFQRPG